MHLSEKLAGLLLVLLVSSVGQGRDLSANNGKIMGFNPSFPKQLRNDCTFYAELTSDLTAIGRGNTTASYSGGTMTGAGSLRGCVDCSGIIHWQISGPCYSCGGNSLALESMGARTNLMIDNGAMVASWTPVQLDLASNGAVIGPDNTSSTMFVMVENTTAGVAHAKVFSYTSTTAKNQAGSIYAKAGARTWLALQITDGFTANIIRYYNLATGALGSSAVTGSASHWWESSSSISPAGNGWYRCVVVTGTPTGTAKKFAVYIAEADLDVTYTGNSSSLFICYPQVEDNATFASAPIFTAGATGARAADKLSYDKTGNVPPSGFGATMQAKVMKSETPSHYLMTTADSSALNGYFMNQNGSTLKMGASAGGAGIIGETIALNSWDVYSIAGDGSGSGFYKNRELLGSNTTRSLPTHDGTALWVNTLNGNGTIHVWVGTIGEAKVFSSRLTAWELGLLR